MFFDPLYFVFALPALLLALYAQMKVQSAYARWQQVPNRRGYTGYDTARALLSAGQMGDVGIEGVPGKLSDHYDPRARMLRLSGDVANGRSVASLAIVAHEIGHVAQDAESYVPLKARNVIVPVAQIGSNLGPILVILGLVLAAYLRSPASREFAYQVAWFGVLLFGVALAFTLITLPVEFNASARARAMLTDAGLIYADEMPGVRAVLDAAALTYVAAAAQALSQLLYYIMLLGGFRRRD